jgi:hypothetical protein
MKREKNENFYFKSLNQGKKIREKERGKYLAFVFKKEKK